MYADVDETTGDALAVSEPIPLPALNVSDELSLRIYSMDFTNVSRRCLEARLLPLLLFANIETKSRRRRSQNFTSRIVEQSSTHAYTSA